MGVWRGRHFWRYELVVSFIPRREEKMQNEEGIVNPKSGDKSLFPTTIVILALGSISHFKSQMGSFQRDGVIAGVGGHIRDDYLVAIFKAVDYLNAIDRGRPEADLDSGGACAVLRQLEQGHS